jgi:hypothetical protein
VGQAGARVEPLSVADRVFQAARNPSARARALGLSLHTAFFGEKDALSSAMMMLIWRREAKEQPCR